MIAGEARSPFLQNDRSAYLAYSIINCIRIFGVTEAVSESNTILLVTQQEL